MAGGLGEAAVVYGGKTPILIGVLDPVVVGDFSHSAKCVGVARQKLRVLVPEIAMPAGVVFLLEAPPWFYTPLLAL